MNFSLFSGWHTLEKYFFFDLGTHSGHQVYSRGHISGNIKQKYCPTAKWSLSPHDMPLIKCKM